MEAGKEADFVVVDGNPVHDIAVLGRPENILLVAQWGVVRKKLL
ncbi:hypothetical protein [Streptomyces sp. 2A115]